jgi:hypothetical protein
MDIFRMAGAMMVGLGLAGAGQAAGFDPRETCARVLAADDAARTMVAAWTFGYIAANTDNVRPVDASNNAILLANLDSVCAANSGASLLKIVAASRRPESSRAAETPASPAPPPGSEAEARALLMRYFAPDADFHALTQALLPAEADVKALYAEPLASALWESLSAQMGHGTAFGPKPGQNDLIIAYATTGALAQGEPVLEEFPGGYRDVAPYFLINVPIVRFKFVEAGEEMGLAFDGLVHLDGRWLIIPKPWRSLPG